MAAQRLKVFFLLGLWWVIDIASPLSFILRNSKEENL
jgi:hypothetical protein